ncbi:MAG: tyrosine-type recombinase/integrase [Bacteroidota bacterium]
MANINFYLKTGQPNKNGEKSLLMRITYGSTRTIIFLNRMVHPTNWNSNRQIVRTPGKREADNNYEIINETIKVFRNKAEAALLNATKMNIELNERYLKSWFSGKHEEKKIKTNDFFELFEIYLDSIKSDREANTIKGYTTIRNFLKAFESDTGYFINIKEIDHSFLDVLKKYALTKRKIAHNYFAKVVSVLKSFLKWAKEHKVVVTDEFKSFSFAEKEKEVIFLTLEELMSLYEFDFKSSRLNNARDLYCFGCFTGLRVSDIIGLKNEHIKDGNIHKTIKKSKKPGIIPLNQFALEILERHSNLFDRPLPKISAQRLNDFIKECCMIAGIDEPTTIIKFYGGRAEEKTQPKYELITTHTARKTFLTNSIILGMNYMAAKDMSGHKKEKNFNKYVKIAEDFKKREMDRTWGQLESHKKKE